MKLVLTDPSSTKLSSTLFLKSLDRSRSTLILWSDGYGVEDGELDEVVTRSPLLHQKVSEFLVNIGNVLTEEVLPRLGLDRKVQARVLKRLAKETSSSVNPDKPLGEISHGDNDSDEDDGSSKTGSDSEQSSELESEDMEDYALEIETDVECLLELDAFIRTPTLDLEAKTSEDLESVSGDLRPIEDTFGSLFFVLIKDRFPKAPFDLAMPLSSAYMNQLRERERFDEPSITPCTKDVFPISVPYCPEKGKPRIPSLPRSTIHCGPFKCPTGREYQRFSSDDAWQKHAFNDMKLWVCHEQECKRRSRPFTEAISWAYHLEFKHSYGPDWPPITCAFYGEKTDSGKSAICLHLDSHFKETCLDATEAVVRYQGLSTKLENFKHTTQVDEGVPFLNVEKVPDDYRGGVMSDNSGQAQSDVSGAIHLGESSKPLAKSRYKGKAIGDVVEMKALLPPEKWTKQWKDWDQSSDDDLDLGLGSELAMPTSMLHQALLDDAQGSQDHTPDQNDEHFPYDIDKLGEGKVTLLGDRKYKRRTFQLPSRGDRIFMLANECASVLGYRRPRDLFDNYKAPLRFVISQDEMDLLVQQGFFPASCLPEGQVEIVTARSVFKQHGRYAIVNGRKFHDDYWEHRARLKEKEWERDRSTQDSLAHSPLFDSLETKPGYDAKQDREVCLENQSERKNEQVLGRILNEPQESDDGVEQFELGH
ncbi:hypothetical protein QQZ08_004175 [Neonectria magnoliae]|uniref:C2H2-type domain-containing protein n=1 Tax=Neonectria magnoliae TaxID=2732573 RepID=A0ABR1I977_9HYPO